jgi:hypothetical protein
MNSVLYDAAVLVAGDRNERWAWAEHKARLRRFLIGCEVVPLGEGRRIRSGAVTRQERRMLWMRLW